MQLADLLRPWIMPDLCPNILVTGLSLDSRTVKPGDVFFACTRVTADALDRVNLAHIEQAIDRGAVAILLDIQASHFVPKQSVITLSLPDFPRRVGEIAARFFGSPSAAMTVVGMTGTNGKTSVAHFLATSLAALGQRCGMIGTLGVGRIDEPVNQWQETGLTTPDPITLQAALANFRQSKTHAVAIEASSHGLAQGRLRGVQMDIGVFTNLSHDHLDYHDSLSDYGAAKEKLLTETGLHTAVINVDDPVGLQWAEKYHQTLRIYGYGTVKPGFNIPMVQVSQIEVHQAGISAHVNTPWGQGSLRSTLLGRFNLDNLLAVLTTLGTMGFPLSDILAQIAVLKGVPGRMQSFGIPGRQPHVVIDYAHTPDALAKALTALKPYQQGKLWCVMGCGGDRDAAKRPLMGQVAESLCDALIITNDNPRNESPEGIVADIKSGLSQPEAATVIFDRKAAIVHAMTHAANHDTILIAGKGHEAYQQMGAEKIPLSDVGVVQQHMGQVNETL